MSSSCCLTLTFEYSSSALAHVVAYGLVFSRFLLELPDFFRGHPYLDVLVPMFLHVPVCLQPGLSYLISQGRNSGGAAPVHASGKSLFGRTNGVLWPQKYNLLGKSCNAGQCHPGFFLAPKLPGKGASVQNAQHYSSRNISF